MVENGEDQNTAPHFAQNRRACVQRGGPSLGQTIWLYTARTAVLARASCR